MLGLTLCGIASAQNDAKSVPPAVRGAAEGTITTPPTPASVRAAAAAGASSTEEAEIRRRQKSRAIAMALVLAALVILFYAISIAKML